jgi:hypothetical protein
MFGDTQLHHWCERGTSSSGTSGGRAEERHPGSPGRLPAPIISDNRDRSVKGLASLGPWWTALRAALD